MTLDSSKTSSGGIIYVAGYSRSGSTILGMLLGAHPDICSVGEVNNIISDWQMPSYLCSCGEPYPLCEFWRDLGGRVSLSMDLAARFHKIEQRANVNAVVNGNISTPDIQAYTDFARGLFSYVREKSGRRYVLDSSKSARSATGRMLALDHYSGERVYVIHLIRSLSSTAASYIEHGSNWSREGRQRERFFRNVRAMAGWFLTHRMVIRLRRLFAPDHQLTLFYEDLIEHPQAAMERIGKMLRLDMTPVLEKIAKQESFVALHDVGGNRARMEPQKLRRGKVKPVRIPFFHRVVAAILEARIRRLLPKP